ncbi:12758_t:CDS:2 [Gigaspora margarita]|uniref:12758_t:CDS:1 n=1 Tax=Gigaspora margarita TaxID=4874 RepID=A0ABM8VXD8_GIGMA|nr:12758_t:CDS:2 [Gigaspora margarita]
MYLSECSNIVVSFGSIELNLSLTRQQPSAMLDSSEAIISQNQTYCTKTFTQKVNMKNTRMVNFMKLFISSELSDSSNENEPDDCNINSQHKYSFNIKVNDPFNSFEEIGKKLDKYAMECRFAVRKGRTHTYENGSVWNATWIYHLSSQWQPKKN